MEVIRYAVSQGLWLVKESIELTSAMGIGIQWVFMTIRCVAFALLDAVYFFPNLVWYIFSPNIIRRVSYRASAKTKKRNFRKFVRLIKKADSAAENNRSISASVFGVGGGGGGISPVPGRRRFGPSSTVPTSSPSPSRSLIACSSGGISSTSPLLPGGGNSGRPSYPVDIVQNASPLALPVVGSGRRQQVGQGMLSSVMSSLGASTIAGVIGGREDKGMMKAGGGAIHRTRHPYSGQEAEDVGPDHPPLLPTSYVSTMQHHRREGQEERELSNEKNDSFCASRPVARTVKGNGNAEEIASSLPRSDTKEDFKQDGDEAEARAVLPMLQREESHDVRYEENDQYGLSLNEEELAEDAEQLDRTVKLLIHSTSLHHSFDDAMDLLQCSYKLRRGNSVISPSRHSRSLPRQSTAGASEALFSGEGGLLPPQDVELCCPASPGVPPTCWKEKSAPEALEVRRLSAHICSHSDMNGVMGSIREWGSDLCSRTSEKGEDDGSGNDEEKGEGGEEKEKDAKGGSGSFPAASDCLDTPNSQSATPLPRAHIAPGDSGDVKSSLVSVTSGSNKNTGEIDPPYCSADDDGDHDAMEKKKEKKENGKRRVENLSEPDPIPPLSSSFSAPTTTMKRREMKMGLPDLDMPSPPPPSSSTSTATTTAPSSFFFSKVKSTLHRCSPLSIPRAFRSHRNESSASCYSTTATSTPPPPPATTAMAPTAMTPTPPRNSTRLALGLREPARSGDTVSNGSFSDGSEFAHAVVQSWKKYKKKHRCTGDGSDEDDDRCDSDEDDVDEEDAQNLHNRANLDIYLPVSVDSLFRAISEQNQRRLAGDLNFKMKKFPIVICVSGGAWIVGCYLWNFLIARVLASRGYVVFCPDYRNFPQTTMEGMTLDVSDAISWVLKNAERYNGDLDDVTLVGQSAGAHLTMMSLLSQAHLCGYKAKGGKLSALPPPSPVAYNVARYNPRASIHRYIGLSGIYNVRHLVKHLNKRGLYRHVLHRMAGGKENMPRYSLNSYFDPCRLADTGEVLPDNLFDFLPQKMNFLHGNADCSAPVSESAAIASILRKAQQDLLAQKMRLCHFSSSACSLPHAPSHVGIEKGRVVVRGNSGGGEGGGQMSCVGETEEGNGEMVPVALTLSHSLSSSSSYSPALTPLVPPVTIKFILIPGTTHTDAIIEEPLAASNSHLVDFLHRERLAKKKVEEEEKKEHAGANCQRLFSSSPPPARTVTRTGSSLAIDGTENGNSGEDKEEGTQAAPALSSSSSSAAKVMGVKPDMVLLTTAPYGKRPLCLRVASFVCPF